MIDKLRERLKAHRSVALFSHIRPDGDAIGSQVAMGLWCQKNGIEVRCFNDDDLKNNLIWLSDFFLIEKPDPAFLDQCDAIVFLDGNAPERFGRYADYFRASAKPFYLIDHHPDPEDFFELAYSVPTASSTAELVYHLFQQGDIRLIDGQIARALYTGMMTDTGSFRFDSVTPDTHLVLSDLLRLGKFSPDEVHQRIYDDRTLNQLHLLGMVLNRVELHYNNQISTMTVTEAMLRKTGCTYSDLEGFVSHALSINSVKSAIIFCELEGKVKVSFRAKRDVDVNLVARQFGGGGHKKAAGSWHPGPLNVAVEEMVRATIDQFTESP
ncbi:MAG: bifunctional oligoribonuclease/PAP phosphatase NrnA [Balneolales bacterium]